MNRIEQAIQNTKQYAIIKNIPSNPIIPLYADNDGLWYFYTIWHLEQLTKL